jgi:hypothetical protein
MTEIAMAIAMYCGLYQGADLRSACVAKIAACVTGRAPMTELSTLRAYGECVKENP